MHSLESWEVLFSSEKYLNSPLRPSTLPSTISQKQLLCFFSSFLTRCKLFCFIKFLVSSYWPLQRMLIDIAFLRLTECTLILFCLGFLFITLVTTQACSNFSYLVLFVNIYFVFPYSLFHNSKMPWIRSDTSISSLFLRVSLYTLISCFRWN